MCEFVTLSSVSEMLGEVRNKKSRGIGMGGGVSSDLWRHHFSELCNSPWSTWVPLAWKDSLTFVSCFFVFCVSACPLLMLSMSLSFWQTNAKHILRKVAERALPGVGVVLRMPGFLWRSPSLPDWICGLFCKRGDLWDHPWDILLRFSVFLMKANSWDTFMEHTSVLLSGDSQRHSPWRCTGLPKLLLRKQQRQHISL